MLSRILQLSGSEYSRLAAKFNQLAAKRLYSDPESCRILDNIIDLMKDLRRL